MIYQEKIQLYLRKEQAGFTLIELLITITILGVLVGMALPNMNRSIANSKMKRSASQLNSFFKMARSDALNHRISPVSNNASYRQWSYSYSANNTSEKIREAIIDSGIDVTLSGTMSSGLQFHKTGQNNLTSDVMFSFCSAGTGIKSYNVTLYRNGSSEIKRGNECT